jgi:hypothetical protein
MKIFVTRKRTRKVTWGMWGISQLVHVGQWRCVREWGGGGLRSESTRDGGRGRDKEWRSAMTSWRSDYNFSVCAVFVVRSPVGFTYRGFTNGWSVVVDVDGGVRRIVLLETVVRNSFLQYLFWKTPLFFCPFVLLVCSGRKKHLGLKQNTDFEHISFSCRICLSCQTASVQFLIVGHTLESSNHS